MDTKSQAAWDIAQGVMTAISEAHISGDFNSFQKYFAVPIEFETFRDTVEVKDTEELRRIFDRIQTYFQSVGLTDMVRQVLAAEFKDETTISSAHENRLMSGTTLLVDPYPGYVTLQKTDEGWQITAGMFAIQSAPDLEYALHGSSE